MKRLLALLCSSLLCLTLVSAAPKVRVNEDRADEYKATFALYASSESAGVSNRFICTAEAISKVKGGYELLSAGHCTPANADELPSDLTFEVSDRIGGELHPVQLVKAVMKEPIDYSIFYFPTDKKYPVLKLGNEQDSAIGDEVIVANCTEGVVKQAAKGEKVSGGISSDPEITTMFEIQIMAGPGASGSAVVDAKSGKVIGILTLGLTGELVLIEPISVVEDEIQGLEVSATTAAHPEIKGSPTDLDLWRTMQAEEWQKGHNPSHPNHPGHPSNPGGGHSGKHAVHPSHTGRGNHLGLHESDVKQIGNHYCVPWYGYWFFVHDGHPWPYWFFGCDVYLVQDVNGNWFAIDYCNPDLTVQIDFVE